MKCQKCGVNNANIVIKQNINGEKQTIYLCSSCIDSNEMINFENKFSNIFNQMFNNFDIFDESTLTMLMPKVNVLINNNNQSYCKRHNLESIDFKKINDDNINVKKESETLSDLELKLKNAIIEEKYEDAAVFRDKIKLLKKKGV